MLNDKPVIATLPAVDLERAKDFYENKLGLKAFRSDEAPGYLFVEGDGGVELILYKAGAQIGSNNVATFVVEDLEKEMKELAKMNIDFLRYQEETFNTSVNGISDQGEAKRAWFSDSEGNILSLTEFKDVDIDEESL